MASSRLIIVPQFPAKMRYQEWWPDRLRRGYDRYFDEVVVLMPYTETDGVVVGTSPGFSDVDAAIRFELEQMKWYAALEVDHHRDVLLLCDLSFPGFFSSLLFHKRPARCFAVCHATSLNYMDYFGADAGSKWPVELSTGKLFSKLFVASEYHKLKLVSGGFDHRKLRVVRFPHPVKYLELRWDPCLHLASVARRHPQKVNFVLEEELVRRLQSGGIHRFADEYPSGTWGDYARFLSSTEFLIITSSEETYGYQVVDALMYGAMPVAPRIASYPELLPESHLYSSGDVDSLISTIGNLSRSPSHPALWQDDFIEVTASEMLQ